MKFIILIILLSLPVLAQRQSLNSNIFPNRIVADACGVQSKTIKDFIKSFGPPKNTNSIRVPNPHSDTRNILSTYTWSYLEAVFMTLPDKDPNLEKTFIVRVKTTKTMNSKQKVKIGEAIKDIEKIYGTINQKLNPPNTSKIVFWIENEIGPDTLTYTFNKDKVAQIECEYYVD